MLAPLSLTVVQKAATPDSIPTPIMNAPGPPFASVEVTASVYILKIAPTDTAMNVPNHAALNHKTARIAEAVSDSIR